MLAEIKSSGGRNSLVGISSRANFDGLKYLSVIVLLAALLGQTFSKALLVLDYQWNKDYISKNLCVNRNRPEMKCEGKCYLCKKINTDAKKDRDNPGRRVDPGSEMIHFEMVYELVHPLSIDIVPAYPSFGERVYARSGTSFFHPPRV
jgi:hypothetical protein